MIACRPGAELIARRMKQFREKGYGVAGINDFKATVDAEKFGFLRTMQVSKTATITLGDLMSRMVPHDPSMDRRI